MHNLSPATIKSSVPGFPPGLLQLHCVRTRSGPHPGVLFCCTSLAREPLDVGAPAVIDAPVPAAPAAPDRAVDSPGTPSDSAVVQGRGGRGRQDNCVIVSFAWNDVNFAWCSGLSLLPWVAFCNHLSGVLPVCLLCGSML